MGGKHEFFFTVKAAYPSYGSELDNRLCLKDQHQRSVPRSILHRQEEATIGAINFDRSKMMSMATCFVNPKREV